jgi:hypothetical protein
MGNLLARLQVQNSTEKPRILWVEPWAEDFTLLAGEELEIIARSTTEQPWFHIVEWPESSQVYLEGVSKDYEVLQNGIHLGCGHNRKAARDAGLKL